MRSKISQSASRVNPSMIVKQQFQVQIQQMRRQSFKSFNLQTCQIHYLPKQLICNNQSCKSYNQLLCKDCSQCEHNLVSINKLVPLMCQWIFEQNSQIQNQNKKLIDEWNVVSQNMTYCIEIFQELIKIIHNHIQKKIYAPKKFIDITNIIYGMWSKNQVNQSAQLVMKNWNLLQKKYNLINSQNKHQNKQNIKDTGANNINWKDIKCYDLQQQKKQRLNCAIKGNKKSKQFSQKALAFSQQLAQLIQSKIKQQQYKNKIKQIKHKNELCLKDLLNKYNKLSQKQQQKSNLTQMLQNIQTFTMQLSGKQSSKLLQYNQTQIQTQLNQISKLKNLKQLKINNKNGKINHQIWYHILNYIQILKFLKNIKFILTSNDLLNLTKLFKQKQNAIRQIQSLSLQINDQKQFDLSKVNQFINTLQLRKLNLNLSRNNLQFKQVYQFIKKIKIYTSLSQLPLIQCNIILTANKIHNDQKIQLQKLFKQICKDVKIYSLTL